MMSRKNLCLIKLNLNNEAFFRINFDYDFTKKLIHTTAYKFFHCNSVKNKLFKACGSHKFTYIKNTILLHSTLSTNKKEKLLNNTFIQSVTTVTPKWVQYAIYNKNETTFYVFPEYILPFLFYLKNHVNTQFKMLIDVTAVDYPSRVSRFQVVYHLLSISYNARIRIKTCVDEVTTLSSVTTLYSSAGWWEREVWDMFGIFFSNHPDLRRILTDYGFQGHPLRKDFPLSGFVEVRYDDSEKRVITEPVEMTQEFRYFDFTSPWEQIEKI